MKLGIVGRGFVGSAVSQGFTRDCTQHIIDPKYYSNHVKDLVAYGPEATFICVPTPQTDSGEADVSIIISVLNYLKELNNHVVIIKSTVPAYRLSEFKEAYPTLRIVYNPEFLTEKNYIEDFKNPPMHVFGGDKIDTEWVEQLYKNHSVCNECPIFHTDLVSASFVKYSINSFLATKVTFFNELYDVYRSAGGKNFDALTKIISNDPRVGSTHMQVPGNDGQRGYAGSCFPKDTSALAYFAREILSTPFTQLETSIKINNDLRKR